MQLLVLFFHVIGSGIVIFFLGGKFEWKGDLSRAEKRVAILILASLLTSLSIINGNGRMPFLNLSVLHFIFMLFYLYLYKKGTMIEKVYWVTLIACISSCTTQISLLVFKELLLSYFEYYMGYAWIVLIIGTLLGVEYISLWSVTKYTPNLSYLGHAVLICSTLVNIFWPSVFHFLAVVSGLQFAVLGALLLVLSYIVHFLIIDLLSKNMTKLFEIEIDYQNMQLKTKYFDEVELINQEVRKYRHDLANHLNMLYYFVDTNNFEEAKQYLEWMGIDLEKINKGFYYIETGNQAMDFILNSKLLVAREKGIKVEANVGTMHDLFVSNLHLCTLLGNLLDNSIEACQLFEKGEPFIQINIQLKKILSLILKIVLIQ